RGMSLRSGVVIAMPIDVGNICAAKYAYVRTGEQRQYGFGRTLVRGDGGGHMVERRRNLSGMKKAGCVQKISREQQSRRWVAFGNLQELKTEFQRVFKISTHHVKDPDAAE